MTKKILLFSIIMVLCLSWHIIGFAQEEETETTTQGEVIEEIDEEQTITAEDLGVKEPKLLPNSPFYFLKDWWRGTKLFFTFNRVKDAELRQRITNEKLLEIRKMAETNVEEKFIEKARNKYKIQQEKLGKAIEKIKDKESEKVDKFKDKFFQHQILHQKILDKLEQTVPEEIFEEIKSMRLEHIDRFKETMFKIEEQTQVQERLENALENIRGSEFKDFKNLGIIRKIRERVENEERNKVLENVEEKLKQNFRNKIKELPAEAEEEIEAFFEKLEGEAEIQLEILKEIQEQAQEQNQVRVRVQAGLEIIKEKVREQTQEQINKPDDKGSSGK